MAKLKFVPKRDNKDAINIPIKQIKYVEYANKKHKHLKISIIFNILLTLVVTSLLVYYRVV